MRPEGPTQWLRGDRDATDVKRLMRDGTYAISIDADGHLADGELVLDGLRAEGGSVHCAVKGQISRTGAHTVGALTMEWAPGALRNTRIARVFAVSMTGVGTDTDFRLWGLGPLGLIVEVTGTHVRPERQR